MPYTTSFPTRPAVVVKVREVAGGRFGVVREERGKSGKILATFETREEARKALPRLRA
jgi:hypothetical protein